jgi:phosphoserine aminotransferase
MATVYNFNAGPAVLPKSVLEHAQSELLDFRGTGMSILEMSHRSKDFEAVVTEAESLARELYGFGDSHRVLFLQGGASLQFSMVPMNFLPAEQPADYIVTGSWSEKALAEAQKLGDARVAASSADTNHNRIPGPEEIRLSDNPAYVHITSNNTIFGTQWQTLPTFGSIPIVADFSSDVFSRPVDVAPYGLIYAGLQKNGGTSGATMVIIRQDFLERDNKALPSMLRYALHAKNNSLYNTPPMFSIYVSMLVMRWLRDEGGLAAVAERNAKKAAILYEALDSSGGFYVGHALPEARSVMNVTFRLKTEELEKQFLAEAKAQGFVGVNGHRSVGGVRASCYNAQTFEACEAFAAFMKQFAAANG